MIKSEIINFIDIGVNLVSSMYSGIYNGSQKHESDLNSVFYRSWNAGVQKLIITGTDLEESTKAVQLSKLSERLYSTVGYHPTNCSQLEKCSDSNLCLDQLVQLYEQNKNKVVALGEFGLDYDRLEFCQRETQLKYFEKQLLHFEVIKLPLFLHCRNAADDLIEILSRHRDKFSTGVVHSFDGNIDQARKFLDLGLFIGLNGCSLKTEDNLKVVQELPVNKILFETDSPWCEVRPTHAGYRYIDTKFESVKKEKWNPEKMVKGRNEPCTIVQILEIVSKIKDEDKFHLAKVVYENTEKLFFSSRPSD